MAILKFDLTKLRKQFSDETILDAFSYDKNNPTTFAELLKKGMCLVNSVYDTYIQLLHHR